MTFAAARTGVFGGTFNPIHLGHLRAAEELAELLGLERVIFVPNARPPHKSPQKSRGDTIAPAADRLAWVKLAIADNPSFQVDSIELDREGPSYLVETLRAVSERTAPERPVFLLGRDAFQEMESWREPAMLLELAHFAVATRPPAGPGGLDEWLPKGLAGSFEVAADGQSAQHRSAGTWIRLLEITALEVSASAIRDSIRAGRSVRYLVPESVRGAISSSGCYTEGAP